MQFEIRAAFPFNYRTEERFYERAVKEKVSPKPPKVLGS